MQEERGTGRADQAEGRGAAGVPEAPGSGGAPGAPGAASAQTSPARPEPVLAPTPYPAPEAGEAPFADDCPLIGISAYDEEAAWGIWKGRASLLPQAYIDSVAGSGGVPLLLPSAGPHTRGAAAPRAARATVAALDALIIAGGPDVGPEYYGARRHAETVGMRPERDAWELALIDAALERDIPVLGICRGAQVLNVARGGTLHQHLPDVVGHNAHRPAPAVYATTVVTLKPDELPGSLLGARSEVRCYHHQALAEIGAGLRVTGSAPDGTVESVRLDGRDFVVGVQWHPEMGEDKRLFAALINAARERAASSAAAVVRSAGPSGEHTGTAFIAQLDPDLGSGFNGVLDPPDDGIDAYWSSTTTSGKAGR